MTNFYECILCRGSRILQGEHCPCDNDKYVAQITRTEEQRKQLNNTLKQKLNEMKYSNSEFNDGFDKALAILRSLGISSITVSALQNFCHDALKLATKFGFAVLDGEGFPTKPEKLFTIEEIHTGDPCRMKVDVTNYGIDEKEEVYIMYDSESQDDINLIATLISDHKIIRGEVVLYHANHDFDKKKDSGEEKVSLIKSIAVDAEDLN